MSSYYCKIKVKDTGYVYEAQALDNYFGLHRYGYKTKDGRVYREDEVKEINPK